MADRAGAGERLEVLLGEDLGDQAHSLVQAESLSVAAAGGDAGTFLSPMLQREETVVGQVGGILVAVNGEDAAFMFGTMGLGQGCRGLVVRKSALLRNPKVSSFSPVIKHDLEKASGAPLR